MPVLDPFSAKERSDSSLNKTVLVSLLIHSVVISLLLLSPSFPGKKWTFGPVYTVDLVSVSARALNSQPATELSRDIVRDPPKSLAVKKSDSPVFSRQQVVKKDEMSQVERAIDELRKKVSAADSNPSATQAQRAESDAKMNAYYARIWTRIRSQWALPKGFLPKENIEAVIAVNILRDGSVSSINFEKSSGNKYFDQSALKAVRKANPFPPLPAWVQGNSLDLGVRFHSSELR